MSRSFLLIAVILFATHVSFGIESHSPSGQDVDSTMGLSSESSAASVAVGTTVRFSSSTGASVLPEPDTFAIAAIGALLLLVGKIGRNRLVRAALRSDSEPPKPSDQ